MTRRRPFVATAAPDVARFDLRKDREHTLPVDGSVKGSRSTAIPIT